MEAKINKRAQSGLVTGLVMGVAGLIIAVIIAFVITSTLSSAGLLVGGRTTTTVVNETGHLNGTGYTVAGGSVEGAVSFTLTSLYNSSGDAIALANATLSNAGLLQNTTGTVFNSGNISYTYITKSTEEISTERLNANFTKGVDNVSSKIPTVLLIAAIILILGILTILVGIWQRMRLGGVNI